jgi:hypothetical protein
MLRLSDWFEKHWNGMKCMLGIHSWGTWYPNRNERGHRIGFSTRYCLHCGASAQRRD